MYHYQFKPTARPILVDNNGLEYRYAFVSDLERLTYMGTPFLLIYLDQTTKKPPIEEEVSFIDRVTRLPAAVENSTRIGQPVFLGMTNMKQPEPMKRTSPVSQPMHMRGGYPAHIGSSMPHPMERMVPVAPIREIPRVVPRFPIERELMEPMMGILGARRVIAEQRPMQPSQVAKCMASKYGGSGDPHAHSASFKQVLRAENIDDPHIQVEGFGLTLEGTALTLFQPLKREDYANIEVLLQDFVEEFSMRGIKHNTVSQIHLFKQRENEKVKEAALRFKQYIERCPPREKPQEDRQVVLFIEGIKNEHLKKDLHLKKCMTLDEVTREAVYLVDNCQIYGETSRDMDTMSIDSKNSLKDQSTTKVCNNK
ncbi:hypothetical protein L7F22_039737 [Adiantum nelumboides]|nr:hypothetical protein [Adiantum nelumboides]